MRTSDHTIWQIQLARLVTKPQWLNQLVSIAELLAANGDQKEK